MKKDFSSFRDYFLFSLYILFFISVVFSFRAISSISIGLILVIGLSQPNSADKFSRARPIIFFLVGCGLLFLLQVFAITYTHNIAEGIKLLQRRSGIVIIPLAVFSTRNFLAGKGYRNMPLYLAAILSAASLYCLAINSFNYFSGSAASIFFYHDLVRPLSQHAIQFSILVFIALVSLIEQRREQDSHFLKSLDRSMIIFLSLFLVLLSSKLIICVYVLYLLYFFLHKRMYTTKSLILSLTFIASVAITIITSNPVGNRFRGIFAGNSLLFTQEKFNPGIYFNGVQFRLLEWRLTYEILSEQHAWLSGLTPGDAQSLLNEKYRKMNMYTGIPGSTNYGYLNYHTHNQFLQTLLENGIPGLFAFLFTCFALLKMGSAKQTDLRWVTVLLLIYCFTDAPFETQYGIVIFTFFPVFLYLNSHADSEPNLMSKLFYNVGFTKAISIKQPN